MDNIVEFPTKVETPDITPKEEMINIIYNDDGMFSFSSSNPNAKDLLFQLELAKHIVINAYLSSAQGE